MTPEPRLLFLTRMCLHAQTYMAIRLETAWGRDARAAVSPSTSTSSAGANSSSSPAAPPPSLALDAGSPPLLVRARDCFLKQVRRHVCIQPHTRIEGWDWKRGSS